MEGYKQKRLAEPSGRTPSKLTAPATVNREVACLKAIFNKAIANEKAERSPFQGKKVKMLKENNERDRLLTPEEYVRLQGHDYFRIMAASGHKTMHVFKRYNTVSKDELKSLVGENR
ncbi:MAG: hypothetical protein HY790_08395 [Deltaproteobacteria bacterium]|nr:hypothetical protein [Deltaproteobacteria bacterium]